MVENRRFLDILTHLILIVGVAVVAFPVYIAFIASTHEPSAFVRGVIPLLPGDNMIESYSRMLGMGHRVAGTPPVWLMLTNSFWMAIIIAVGKIAISITSAYAIVYFRFPFRTLAFWMIFVTLMLPVEVRIVPTFAVVANLGLLNSYAGLTLPLIASATATFLFRQFFMTVPEELMEAARVDGAGPIKFFKDILLPISITNIAALFVIMFIYGWTQYLWPLLMTNSNSMNTIVIALRKMISFADADTQWHLVMVTAVLAMLPPILVVLLMQRWFVKGLVETEK